MGLKTGSTGDPLEDDEQADEQDEAEHRPAGARDDAPTSRAEDSPTSTQSIPYKFRRDTVKAGRKHIPLYLREGTQEGEKGLRADVEDRLGEDVPLADLREAAYLVAQRNPDLVADELRTWGYALED